MILGIAFFWMAVVLYALSTLLVTASLVFGREWAVR